MSDQALPDIPVPYVHLRYIAKKVSIEYARLDPPDMPDAVEMPAEPAASQPVLEEPIEGHQEPEE